jgi:DNA polymerase-3 subunit delta'
MQFKDVIGQEAVKHHLVEMVAHNRLSHALLFLGKEGSGALSMAIAFAQYVVCDKRNAAAPSAEVSLFDLPPVDPAAPTTAFDSCGTCPSCTKAAQLVHPDIHFSYPVVTKKTGTPPLSADYITEWRDFVKGLPYGNVYDWLQFIGAENKQGNITAQECNDIIRKLNLKSFESGYKILIMWMPEYLGKEGNKLLKLIEEPPADTLFILVAENESSILNTILSRTQLIKIPALEPSDIESELVQKASCAPEQAKQLANAADGNYREALHLLQHADEDFHSLLKDWLNATLRYQTLVQQKCIEEIARLGREKQKQFLRYFIQLLEGAIRLEVANDALREHLQRVMSPAEYDPLSCPHHQNLLHREKQRDHYYIVHGP